MLSLYAVDTSQCNNRKTNLLQSHMHEHTYNTHASSLRVSPLHPAMKEKTISNQRSDRQVYGEAKNGWMARTNLIRQVVKKQTNTYVKIGQQQIKRSFVGR